jgi:hypothetical protein
MRGAIAAILSLCVASGALAAEGTLNNVPHAVTWSGTLHRTDAVLGEVAECVATPCQRFDLTVSLPNGVWNNKPGGLQIAEIDNWTGKGDGPRTYNAPDCLFPQESDATNDYLIQGITRGWADVYE